MLPTDRIRAAIDARGAELQGAGYASLFMRLGWTTYFSHLLELTLKTSWYLARYQSLTPKERQRIKPIDQDRTGVSKVLGELQKMKVVGSEFASLTQQAIDRRNELVHALMPKFGAEFLSAAGVKALTEMAVTLADELRTRVHEALAFQQQIIADAALTQTDIDEAVTELFRDWRLGEDAP